MNLFERVLAHIKSFGHHVESEEHKLLIELVEYIRDDEAALAKFLAGKTDQEAAVVKNFINDIAPAPEPVQVAPEPTPVVETPAPEPKPAPVVETPAPAEEAPAPEQASAQE